MKASEWNITIRVSKGRRVLRVYYESSYKLVVLLKKWIKSFPRMTRLAGGAGRCQRFPVCTCEALKHSSCLLPAQKAGDYNYSLETAEIRYCTCLSA